MYYDSKLSFNFEYLMDLRFNIVNVKTPDEINMRIKGITVKLDVKNIKVTDDTYVNYRFRIEDNVLIETLVVQETYTFIELITYVSEKEKETFLSYIMPYLGVAFYGYLPNKNQPSGMTNRIVSNILSESEKLQYHFNSITLNEKDKEELTISTSDGGFYAFYYSYAKNLRINNDREVKRFFESQIKWKETTEIAQNELKNARLKILIKEFK